MLYRLSLVGLVALALVSQASAAEIHVAVAANFTKPAEALGNAFTAKTGDSVTFSFGASGALYTQIAQGAPFEVFLSADDKRPAQAVRDGLGVEGSVFTYAVGTVVLYAPGIDLTDGKAILAAGAYKHLSIADAKTAPYGAAAIETLEKLGLTDATSSKLVVGENISQTLQFIDSGNAELGFVALSQVVDKPTSAVWRVPADLHAPILQDAVLLKTGADNPAAKAFLDFLRSDEGKAIIEKFGYTLP